MSTNSEVICPLCVLQLEVPVSLSKDCFILRFHLGMYFGLCPISGVVICMSVPSPRNISSEMSHHICICNK